MPIIDESDLDSASDQTGVASGDIEARNRQITAANPNLGQPNRAREQQTVGGEISGGLKQFGQDIATAISPAEKDMGIVERALHVARAPLGLIRAAAPIVTLGSSPAITNAITSGAEAASDYVGSTKIGNARIPGLSYLYGQDITPAAVTGGTTQAIGDVLYGLAQGKLANIAGPLLKAKFPTLSEKATTLNNLLSSGEAGLNAEAAAARAQAEQAATGIAKTSRADVRRIKIKADLARSEAETKAGFASEALPTQQKIEALTPGSTTAEASGSQLRGHYEATKAERSAAKNALYDPLIKEGAGVDAARSNFDASVRTVTGERGLTGTPANQAEKIAGVAKKGAVADEAAVADQIDALQASIEAAPTAEHKALAQSAMKEFVQTGNLPKTPTVADLVNEHKRINEAIAASRNDNLTRQLNTLKSGIEADINAVPGNFGTQLSKADRYYAESYAPLFGRKSEIRAAFQSGDSAVVDQLIPKATDKLRDEKLTRLVDFTAGKPEQQKALGDGLIKNIVGDATNAAGDIQFQKLGVKWQRYADTRSGDKVLKAVLGDRYDSMKELVANTQRITPKSIDDTLSATIKGIDANTKARVASTIKESESKLGSLQGLLGEGEKYVNGIKVASQQGTIESTRLAKIAALKKEIETKAAKLQGSNVVSQTALQTAGLGTLIYGAIGLVLGAPQALASIVTGGLVLLSRPAIIKLTNSVKGLNLINRAMRAQPGTAAAAANARIIQRYVQEEKGKAAHE